MIIYIVNILDPTVVPIYIMYLWHTEGTLSPLNNVLYRYLLSTGYVNYVPSFTQKILRCCYAGFLSHINKNTTHTLSLSISYL